MKLKLCLPDSSWVKLIDSNEENIKTLYDALRDIGTVDLPPPIVVDLKPWSAEVRRVEETTKRARGEE
eukprot:snap_masked-scaffold_95-processed-gene-0.9-mRNA-1 protein AED:1.00 eAED:1.00 QI:0/-1/0/0/-1/1/1/0/67